MSLAIEVEGVAKSFRRVAPGLKLRTLKSALVDRSLTAGLSASDAIPALEDVSFTVEAGQSLGIVGSNGSGKSTLLKVLSGILKPERGKVEINGRVAALIELGAGFHPEISGRENIYINGAVLGLSRREIDKRYDEIVEFSGLADFIEEPVKNYSSGMYVRLGFSVAIHTDPDVLLIDEVLAVGDAAFSHRCLRRIEELLGTGRTVVMVSHSLELIESLSDTVLWLDHGRVAGAGAPRQVVDAYRQAVAEEEGRAHREAKDHTGGKEDAGRRWGSGDARIEAVRLLDAGGEERYHFASGEALSIEFEAEARESLDDFVFGVALATPRGVECWGTNTQLEGYEPETLTGRSKVTIECPELRLAAGEYLLDLAIHAKDGTPYDYRKGVAAFTVTSETRGVGVYEPVHGWQFHGPVRWRREPRRR